MILLCKIAEIHTWIKLKSYKKAYFKANFLRDKI